jgi:hypothetical protein
MAHIQLTAPRRLHFQQERTAPTARFTDVARLTRFRPRDTAEALDCMRQALEFFYARQDDRAIFLRSYYIMTAELNAAIHGRGDFSQPIFFDPGWVDRLAGRFACLYFTYLAEGDGADVPEPWKKAHAYARKGGGSVLVNLLLGINAHINYDLSYGLYENFLDHEDHEDHLRLPRRKFDHDQINNLLGRANPKIQDRLTREFGGGLRLLSNLAGSLDETLTITGLKHFRERVWGNSLSFLATRAEEERELVRQRLCWEAGKVADFITSRNGMRATVRRVGGLLRRRRFGPLELEGPGDIPIHGEADLKLQLPFGGE